MTSTDPASIARTARVPDPIAFRLYDDDDAPALYIDGASGRELHLELHNQSGHDIEFVPSGATASSDNHHLELRFRPGILSQRALKILTSPNASTRVLRPRPEAWDMTASYRDAGSPVSLYLLFKGAEPKFLNDSRMTLSLREMSAAAGQGSRPTQVQLTLRGMRFHGADAPITSTSHRHLNVFYWGRSDLPLRAGFIGTSILVNDGQTENSLLLRVRNTSGETETIGAVVSGNVKSTFTVSFDVGDEGVWWAVASDDVKNALVSVKWPNHSALKEVAEETHGQGLSPHWNLEFPRDGLGPGQEVDIQIEQLKTKGSGPTNLYLTYRNIPGFRNGQLVCAIQRFPCNDSMAAKQVAAIEQHERKIAELYARLDGLFSDVYKLQIDSHWDTTPIDFNEAECAYSETGSVPSPYFAITCSAFQDMATLRAKFGGEICIPNLRTALTDGAKKAMTLVLEDGSLPVNVAHFSGVLRPEEPGNKYRYTKSSCDSILQVKFTLEKGSVVRQAGTVPILFLYLSDVIDQPEEEFMTAPWIMSLNTLNPSTY